MLAGVVRPAVRETERIRRADVESSLTPEQKLAKYKEEQEARKEYARKVFGEYDFNASHHVDIPAGLKKYIVIEGIGEKWKELAELHKNEDWLGIINTMYESKKLGRNEFEDFPDKTVIDYVSRLMNCESVNVKVDGLIHDISASLRIRIKWADDFPGVPLEVNAYDSSKFVRSSCQGRRLSMRHVGSVKEKEIQDNPMIARGKRHRNPMQIYGEDEELLVLEGFSPNKCCRIYLSEQRDDRHSWHGDAAMTHKWVGVSMCDEKVVCSDPISYVENLLRGEVANLEKLYKQGDMEDDEFNEREKSIFGKRDAMIRKALSLLIEPAYYVPNRMALRKAGFELKPSSSELERLVARGVLCRIDDHEVSHGFLGLGETSGYYEVRIKNPFDSCKVGDRNKFDELHCWYGNDLKFNVDVKYEPIIKNWMALANRYDNYRSEIIDEEKISIFCMSDENLKFIGYKIVNEKTGESVMSNGHDMPRDKSGTVFGGSKEDFPIEG